MNIDRFRVLAKTGEEATLGEIRANRAGIIILVRHFGCIFCRQRIAQLTREASAYDEIDLATMVIGNGTATMARDFVARYNIETPVFTDPTRRVYSELGMRRMFGLNYQTLKQSMVAFKEGHRQTRVQGDVWQQGGVVTFDSDGEVMFRAADQEAGSDIPWTSVWKSLTPSSVPLAANE